jgi:hypothetical protein
MDDVLRVRLARLAKALRSFHMVDRFGLGSLLGAERIPDVAVFAAQLLRYDVGLPAGISVDDFAKVIRAGVAGEDSGAHSALSSTLGSLKAVPPGRRGASAYHEAAMALFGLLLGDQVALEAKEAAANGGRKKIDILYRNKFEGGFFLALRDNHGIPCAYIPVECKNYNDDLANPELDQLAGRLGEGVGKVGLLLCRSIRNAHAVEDRLRGFKSKGEYLLVLTDDDFEQMVADSEHGLVDRVLHRKLRELVLS